jgi:hypothetical protein
MKKQTYKLTYSKESRNLIINAILSAPDGFLVIIQPDTRTLAQNRCQWPILSAFAKQLRWPINGAMQFISDEDYKDILTAAYRQEMTRIAQGFDGKSVVMLGHRTREFTAEEWPNWMAFLNWAAAEKGVKVPVSKKRAEEMGFSDEI